MSFDLSSGYRSDDSQTTAVHRNMPLTEAAENDFGGPSISARWIALSLLTSIRPAEGDSLVSDLTALEHYVTDAIDPLDDVISWLKPTDQSILLALYYIDVLVKLNLLCTPEFKTTCGVVVALFLRRALTVGIILAEIRLNDRFPCGDIHRCTMAFQGRRTGMWRNVQTWWATIGTNRFSIASASFKTWVLNLKHHCRLAHIVSPDVGFVDQKTAKAFDSVMEEDLPPPHKF
ncbi:hypothetical protein BKA70DRAFT_1217341 [Coprinopsis sp. MPI-PUGE-AT-0042]|nr:hypothetical protein BKA70DRAFT_1217341 [Coprinopsis sp. MPI-PUGE-AT-0042]